MRGLFGGVLVVGLLALLLAARFEPVVLRSAGLACAATGCLGLGLAEGIRRAVVRRPELAKPDDERLVFIQQRAAVLTVQVMFGYLCLYALVSPMTVLQGVSHVVTACVSLCFLGVVYGAALAVYHRTV